MNRQPKRGTQMRAILDLLKERGSNGVGAHEATYQMGITRMAAIVHTLKTKYGYEIRTIDNGPGTQATYALDWHRAPLLAKSPCACGHPYSGHISGTRCMGFVGFAWCPCEKYTEQKEGVPA